LLATTHATFHLSKTAASIPHILDDIGRSFLDEVLSASAQHAERGGDPFTGFVTPGGSRDLFLGDLRAVELGSDHQVFEAAGFGVPMLYFHDWPDVTIHTHKDQPENLDATKLGRVTYLGAAIAYSYAALPATEAPKLLAVARASAEKDLADARLRYAIAGDSRDGALAVRESIAMSQARLAALARRWPSAAAAADEITKRLAREAVPLPAGAEAAARSRVPVRSPEVRGPLAVYYYDHLSAAYAARGVDEAKLPRLPATPGVDAELIRYEALNLADGVRSVGEIRDILTGRYAAVPLAFVSGWFERLEAAGVVTSR